MLVRFVAVLIASLVAAGAACSSDPADPGAAGAQPASTEPAASMADSATDGSADTSAETPATTRPTAATVAATPEAIEVSGGAGREFPPAPETPDGPLPPDVEQAVDTLLGERLLNRTFDADTFTAIRTLGAAEDPRVAWWLTDLLRVARDPDLVATIGGSLSQLLDIELNPFDAWGSAVDHLIAWDTPAPPDYLRYKKNPYLVVEPRWEPFFADDADIDWRLVSWGGVLIDDRPFGETDAPCNCIPAVDNPEVTDAAGGDEWLADDAIVFGVVINDEARAYPRSIMEVREMVNDTLGGRDFAMPYCTLCGSAQVFFTDELPPGVERAVLRTSGLLSRSNKVMYDLVTMSVFDTFRGAAVSGPLLDAEVVLPQHSVFATTWAEWKSAHPDTTVLAVHEALGRPNSDLRNTRDADGPIFPIGDVDPRLPVQEDVIGVITASGEPVAFHVAAAINALERGEVVTIAGITLSSHGGGLRATTGDGNEIASHQAFWFAWSQFHPGTQLWPADIE